MNYLLDDRADGFLFDVLATLRHEEAVLDVQFFHVFEYLLVLGVHCDLFLPDVLDQLTQDPILLK